MTNLKDPLILVVDDDKINLELLQDALCPYYTVITATTGKQAFQQLNQYQDKLIVVLLDINLPDIGGIDVLKKAYQQGWTQKIIFIMMSCDTVDQLKIECLENGAVDFITKPTSIEFVQKRIARAISDYKKQQAFYNILVDQITQRDTRTALLIYILAQVLKQSNNESGEHVLHIRIITRIILEALMKISNKYDLSIEDISSISLAACLHDIGKVKIANEILNKPGKLTPEEFEEVKKHTIYGEEMLKEYADFRDDTVLTFAQEICRWHHERWDGGGYPDKLAGEEIPLWAQAVAIADCYDALTSDRCYKKAYTHEEAISMILSGKCGQFNPDIIRALLVAADKLKKRLAVKDTVELDSKQDAKRFADTVLKQYKQHLD